jgi:uncharacterized protein (DUF433 family)
MQGLTTNEVVALFSLDARRVRKEVEHGVIDAASPPRFGVPAVVYLHVLDDLGVELGSVEDRKRLYGLISLAIERGNEGRVRVALSKITEVTLDEIFAKVKERMEQFIRWKESLVVREDLLGGEPVFPKSRLAVRQVGGMLARGASADEIREDYPYLRPEDLEFAKLYALAHPQVGRPRERQAPPR